MRKFRIFLNPIEGQEKWLNKKSKEGLKLSKVGKLFYEFKKCKPNQYQYAVDYIGNKSNTEREDYEGFLEDMEINYYEKPINLGQFSSGRVKYRPYANTGGKLATSGGMINRELLILEKKNNGKPFNIYDNVKDKMIALKERRKPYIYLFVFTIIMGLYIHLIGEPLVDFSLWSYRNHLFDKTITCILLGLIGVIPIVRIAQLSLSIRSLKDKKDIHE
ncbi:MAG: DUF2812 domain-containing protein [Tissierella sp.]|nr:DUF2812 domain-containing protein [Tissierella sp.]